MNNTYDTFIISCSGIGITDGFNVKRPPRRNIVTDNTVTLHDHYIRCNNVPKDTPEGSVKVYFPTASYVHHITRRHNISRTDGTTTAITTTTGVLRYRGLFGGSPVAPVVQLVTSKPSDVGT